MFATWDIPEPIPTAWIMRDLASAQITIRELPDGTLEQKIEHGMLPGVTPAMLSWWIANAHFMKGMAVSLCPDEAVMWNENSAQDDTSQKARALPMVADPGYRQY